MTRRVQFYLAFGLVMFAFVQFAYWLLPAASPGFARPILASFCALAAVMVVRRIAPLSR